MGYKIVDKLREVSPLITAFEKRCKELDLEENLCIHESITPFKGQLAIKQYIEETPTPGPWGVKVFMLCGAFGIIMSSVTLHQ